MEVEILSPIEEKKFRSGIILFKARKKKPLVSVEELEIKKKIIVQQGEEALECLAISITMKRISIN